MRYKTTKYEYGSIMIALEQAARAIIAHAQCACLLSSQMGSIN
jgi:hypothetical protein